MKHVSTILLIVTVLVGALTASAKETFVFDVNGSDTLKLDFYKAETAKPAPVVIFAFGGTFKHGTRDDARYIPFFNYLVENGVSVISTDYRTKLKGVSPSDLSSKEEVADRLSDAITAAVKDFIKATDFTLAHASEWNINPKEIFACGSSSGAIAALQAEMEICNATKTLPGFPPSFNYAGIISFAGAVFGYGEPYWRKAPAPMLLFHGNADSNVPYHSATFDGFGLWGSKAIADELAETGNVFQLHIVTGADHSVAISPMNDNREEILDFIKAVISGNVESRTITEDSGNSNFRTEFTLEDYLISNFF